MAAFAVVGAALWVAYGEGYRAGSEGVVPLIQAESRPAKRRPSKPGGFDVPYRDKLVYDRIAPDGESAIAAESSSEDEPADPVARDRNGLESVLPAPAAGKPKPEAKPTAVAPRTTPRTSARKKPPEPKVSASAATGRRLAAIKPAAGKAKPPTSPEAGAKPSGRAAAKPAPSQTAKAATGSYRIQVGAMTSRQAALRAWQGLVSKHRDLLGKLGLVVEKFDLGGNKGVVYRLRAGPLGSLERARALCAEMVKRKMGCLVVKI